MSRSIHPATMALLLLAAPQLLATAQAMPAGALRPWIEIGLGGTSEHQSCSGCSTAKFGGPTATAAAGLTITPRLGIGLRCRAMDVVSFDYSQGSSAVFALAQYRPDPTFPNLTLNLGLGGSRDYGDDSSPYAKGSGALVTAGVAVRYPSSSLFGFTLAADWSEGVGSRDDRSGRLRSYRPSTFTLGIGLNLGLPAVR